MKSEWHPPKTVAEWNQFVDLVVGGKYTLKPGLYDLVTTNLSKCLEFEEILLTDDNKKRVELLSRSFPCIQFRKILRSVDEVLTKNDKVRKHLEDRGDSFLKSSDNEKALHCYALALCFALTSKASIYMKRVAILVRLKKYDIALIDVERALGNDVHKSMALQVALPEQKNICEALIAPKIVNKENFKRKEYTEQIISKVEGENPSLMSLPDFISVEYHPVKGRYLVTNIDLEPGSGILLADPYVSATVNHLTWQTKHCDWCLKETWNPIPCETCVLRVYCGEQCRADDQKHGHKYECPILPYIHCLKIPTSLYLCFKTICKSGPDVLKSLWIKSKPLNNITDAWFVPPGDTHGNHDLYRQVLNMASHSHANSQDIPVLVWLSISLAYALRIKSTFFDSIEESDKLNFEKFIATIIMYHSESFPFNTTGLGFTDFEIKDLRAYIIDHVGGPRREAASGIFPLQNLMNHACSPTTFRHCLPGGRISMITNRHLKAGEELTQSYGFNHLNFPLSKRKSDLAQNFRIVCDCIACREDWPLLKVMDDSSTSPYVCQPCKTRVLGLLTNSPIKEIEADLLKCGSPIIQNDESPWNMESCDPFSLVLEVADAFVMSDKPLEAVPLLLMCIKHFQKDPCQPSLQLVLAQNRLLHSYDLISNAIIVTKVEKTGSMSSTIRKKFCSIL